MDRNINIRAIQQMLIEMRDCSVSAADAKLHIVNYFTIATTATFDLCLIGQLFLELLQVWLSLLKVNFWQLLEQIF